MTDAGRTPVAMMVTVDDIELVGGLESPPSRVRTFVTNLVMTMCKEESWASTVWRSAR